MKNAICKALPFASNGLDVSGNIPLSAGESRFLIGRTLRCILMSTSINTQRRDDLAVWKVDLDKIVRQESYRDIRQISCADYRDHFAISYLIKTGRGTDPQALIAATDRTQASGSLQGNPKVRVQIREDDFRLRPAGIAWFRSTFGANLAACPTGGHRGNLHVIAVPEALVRLVPTVGDGRAGTQAVIFTQTKLIDPGRFNSTINQK